MSFHEKKKECYELIKGNDMTTSLALYQNEQFLVYFRAIFEKNRPINKILWVAICAGWQYLSRMIS